MKFNFISESDEYFALRVGALTGCSSTKRRSGLQKGSLPGQDRQGSIGSRQILERDCPEEAAAGKSRIRADILKSEAPSGRLRLDWRLREYHFGLSHS